MPITPTAALMLSLGAVLAGCAGPPLQTTQAAAGATGSRCIALNQIAGRRVVESSLLFEMIGAPNYRNDPIGPCPGLERLGSTATISIASGGEGGQLCRGDRVRVADPVEARASGLLNQPTCRLGDFVPDGSG